MSEEERERLAQEEQGYIDEASKNLEGLTSTGKDGKGKKDKKKKKDKSKKKRSAQSGDEALSTSDAQDFASTDEPLSPSDENAAEQYQDISQQPQTTMPSSHSYDDQSELVNELREQNSRLLDEIGDLRIEVEELRKVKAAADLQVPANGDARDQKILELAKKNRDLGMNLAKANGKIATLEKHVQDLEENLKYANELQSFKESGEANSDLLKEKLMQSNTQMAQLRSQLQNTKQELRKTQQALQREVGEQVNLSTIFYEKSTWRGRAQEISLLKERVKELRERLALYESSGPAPAASTAAVDSARGAAPTLAGRPGPGTGINKDFSVDHKMQIEQARQKRVLQQEETTETIQELRSQIAEQKRKMDAIRSRNKILEENQVTLTEKLNTVLEKTRHDDEFIQALQAQNQVLKRKLASASASAVSSIASVTSSPNTPVNSADMRETVLAQERQIARQEQIIRSLRTELDALTTQMMEQQP